MVILVLLFVVVFWWLGTMLYVSTNAYNIKMKYLKWLILAFCFGAFILPFYFSARKKHLIKQDTPGVDEFGKKETVSN